MPIKRYKPTTPTRRYQTMTDRSALHKGRPVKSLTSVVSSSGGRDSSGKVSVRHRGSGVKRIYRKVDFKQLKLDVPGKVERIEYDPFRTSWIALVDFSDGTKSYIIAPDGIKVGQEIVTSTKAPNEVGNRTTLKRVGIGVPIHNIELMPNAGGKIVKSAGSSAYILSKDDNYAIVKLPSSELRKFQLSCFASLGQVSNIDHNKVVWGKAGRRRLKGFRPTVRGKAMYPAAHPHGGGEGGNPIGLKYPKTPWGKIAIGGKTRKVNKASDVFILSRRKKKRRK